MTGTTGRGPRGGERGAIRHRKGARDLAARALILGLLGRMRNGAIIVREGDRRHLYGRTMPGETVPEVVVSSPNAWRAIAGDGTAGLGQGWIADWWTCATLDELTALLRVVIRNLDASDRGGSSFGRRLRGPAARALARPPDRPVDGELKRRSGRVLDDLGEEFFALFLGDTMADSSAIFAGPTTSLHDAQAEKYDRICRKLVLGAADDVLEIGAGWGGFAVHAATRYGCRVTTTTRTRPQFEAASARIAAAGLADLVTVLGDDVTTMTGTYDRIVAIEAMEAMDWRHYERFLATCSSLLKPDGAIALQSVVIADRLYEPAKRTEDYVKRYLAPGSCVPSIGAIVNAAGRATDLQLVALDDIGHHYGETLRRWRREFVRRGDEMVALGVDDTTRRTFEFFLCYREAAFAERRLGDVQCVFARPAWRPRGLAPPVA